MTRTLVRDLRQHIDETVTVYGWINTLRLQRRIQFVLVRDHTGTTQITHRRGGEGDAIEATLENVSVESAVKITERRLIAEVGARTFSQLRQALEEVASSTTNAPHHRDDTRGIP